MTLRHAILTGLMCMAVPARATVGTPELVDVWGWSPEAHGVVYQLHRQDGFDPLHPIVLLRPGLSDSTLALRGCAQADGDHLSEPECERSITALRSHLEPLRPISHPTPRFPFRSRIVSRDTVTIEAIPHPRLVIEARFDWTVLYRITAFYRADVALVARYELPDPSLDLVVLAFIGTEFEGGYETWVPVLVPHLDSNSRDETRVVEVSWKPPW